MVYFDEKTLSGALVSVWHYSRPDNHHWKLDKESSANSEPLADPSQKVKGDVMKRILAIGAGFLMVVLLVTPAVNAWQDTGAKQE